MSSGWLNNKSPPHTLSCDSPTPGSRASELHSSFWFCKSETGSKSSPPWYVLPQGHPPQRTLRQGLASGLLVVGLQAQKAVLTGLPTPRALPSPQSHFGFLIYFSLSLPWGSSAEFLPCTNVRVIPSSSAFSLCVSFSVGGCSPQPDSPPHGGWFSTSHTFLTIWKIFFASLGLNDFLSIFQDQSFSPPPPLTGSFETRWKTDSNTNIPLYS